MSLRRDWCLNVGRKLNTNDNLFAPKHVYPLDSVVMTAIYYDMNSMTEDFMKLKKMYLLTKTAISKMYL